MKEKGRKGIKALAMGVGLSLLASGAPIVDAKIPGTEPCLEYGSETQLNRRGDLWLGKAEVLIVDLKKGSRAVVNGEVITATKNVTNTLAVVDNPTCAENYAFPLVGRVTVSTFDDSMTAEGAIADEVTILVDKSRNHKATFDVVYADQGIIQNQLNKLTE